LSVVVCLRENFPSYLSVRCIFLVPVIPPVRFYKLLFDSGLPSFGIGWIVQIYSCPLSEIGGL